MPLKPLKTVLFLFFSNLSVSIFLIFTLTLFDIPPCVRASNKDLYASFNSRYSPTTPIVTSPVSYTHLTLPTNREV